MLDREKKAGFALEKIALAEKQIKYVAGVDEVGRGPLAGPVVACAVILPLERFSLPVYDSKKLTKNKREFFYKLIFQQATAISICSLNAATIDRCNILQATLAAMKEAVEGLAVQPQHVLIDGPHVPKGLPCSAEGVIQGDQRSVSIAAASIVAKVYRDRLMTRLGYYHPSYGFEHHAGYGTQQHRAILQKDRALPGIHRLSFAPLRLESIKE